MYSGLSGYAAVGPVAGAPAYWVGKPMQSTQPMHSICSCCGQITPPITASQDPCKKLVRLILDRLRICDGEILPFMHLHAYEIKGTRTEGVGPVAVLVVTNSGQATLLEDDSGMFPCDKLITQLRLLAG
jgi:hypothetical protein